MTAQRTQTCSFIEKRHNADCGLICLLTRIKRGYHMLISKDERRLAKPPPYNVKYVILLYQTQLLGWVGLQNPTKPDGSETENIVNNQTQSLGWVGLQTTTKLHGCETKNIVSTQMNC